MTTSEIARTYARVLFDLASAADAVDAADEGVSAAAEAVRGHIDLRTALTDSGIPAEKKRDVMRDIFGEKVTPEVLSVVTLAVERGHTDTLGEIARIFGEIAETERGIVVAEVTTAVPLDDALRSSISDKLVATLGRPVSLRERVDAGIVGGVIIKVGGRVLDGSLSSQLDAVRADLTNASQGGEA
ncbi:MAG: ATP synthase F1 subunit delta [Anaerosomatales bacterium]|nr:ATP synthase F1 subunit delta [Anaerosomatales bacterium]MDT8434757.1 ATP synthase F1 subunit delta [Anaerosomatales bacterium]